MEEGHGIDGRVSEAIARRLTARLGWTIILVANAPDDGVLSLVERADGQVTYKVEDGAWRAEQPEDPVDRDPEDRPGPWPDA